MLFRVSQGSSIWHLLYTKYKTHERLIANKHTLISPISRHIDAPHCMVLHYKRHFLHFTGSSKTKFQMDLWSTFQFGEWCFYSSRETYILIACYISIHFLKTLSTEVDISWVEMVEILNSTKEREGWKNQRLRKYWHCKRNVHSWLTSWQISVNWIFATLRILRSMI